MDNRPPKPLKSKPPIKKVTVRLPAELKQQLPLKILSDRYNMREKSKWVVEAVRSLMRLPDWEGALLSEALTKTDAQDVFTMPTELVEEMNREVARLAMEKPSLNASQSAIIRAAINRRVLGIFTLVE